MEAEDVNRRPGAATINDVARAAGVSTATVSRVLNDSARVSPALALKVSQVVEQLGYRPSHAAQTLRTQRARVWALVIPDVCNPHFTEMVRGIEDVAYKDGYSLILCNTDADADKERSYLELALAERVAGVVLAPTDPPAELIKDLQARNISVVLVDRRLHAGSLDGAFVNNIAGAEQAIDHLVERGYRRLACINGPIETTTGQDRFAGFVNGLKRHQLLLDDPAMMRYGDFRESSGQREMELLLDMEEPPDAVVVANNLMTLGALKAIVARGLDVPRDVALVGFDDSSWNSVVHPPLTCVAQPAYELGAESARLLLRRIGGYSGPVREVMLVPSLRVRQSTTAVAHHDAQHARSTPGIRPTVGALASGRAVRRDSDGAGHGEVAGASGHVAIPALLQEPGDPTSREPAARPARRAMNRASRQAATNEERHTP